MLKQMQFRLLRFQTSAAGARSVAIDTACSPGREQRARGRARRRARRRTRGRSRDIHVVTTPSRVRQFRALRWRLVRRIYRRWGASPHGQMLLSPYRPTIRSEIDFPYFQAPRIMPVSRRCRQARMLQNLTA